jgi:hypothetical protein
LKMGIANFRIRELHAELLIHFQGNLAPNISSNQFRLNLAISRVQLLEKACSCSPFLPCLQL